MRCAEARGLLQELHDEGREQSTDATSQVEDRAAAGGELGSDPGDLHVELGAVTAPEKMERDRVRVARRRVPVYRRGITPGCGRRGAHGRRHPKNTMDRPKSPSRIDLHSTQSAP